MVNETCKLEELIHGLTYMQMFRMTRKLLDNGKKYNVLLNEILKLPPFPDERPYPTPTELQGKAKIGRTLFKKYLSEIYDDFISLIQNPKTYWQMEEIYCIFHLTHPNQPTWFMARVPCIPRVGDNVELDFMKPYFGVSLFGVQEVRHSFGYNHQVVEVFLSRNAYSKYEPLIGMKTEPVPPPYDRISARIRQAFEELNKKK